MGHWPSKVKSYILKHVISVGVDRWFQTTELFSLTIAQRVHARLAHRKGIVNPWALTALVVEVRVAKPKSCGILSHNSSAESCLYAASLHLPVPLRFMHNFIRPSLKHKRTWWHQWKRPTYAWWKSGKQKKLHLSHHFHLLQVEAQPHIPVPSYSAPESWIGISAVEDKRVSGPSGTQSQAPKSTERLWLGFKGGTGWNVVALGKGNGEEEANRSIWEKEQSPRWRGDGKEHLHHHCPHLELFLLRTQESHAAQGKPVSCTWKVPV